MLCRPTAIPKILSEKSTRKNKLFFAKSEKEENMKKILAFVLTLAMMLTLLNVGFISTAAKTADGPIVTITDQATVTVDGTEYTVVDALPTTAGNYILKQDVVAEAGYTFPAGVVLHGNGYTITLEGNAVETPATEAPFILPAGTSAAAASVTITNVNFGTATAPIYLLANESKTDEEPIKSVNKKSRKDINPIHFRDVKARFYDRIDYQCNDHRYRRTRKQGRQKCSKLIPC